MAATSIQIGTFKRHARRVHALWNSLEYPSDPEVNDKVAGIEASMEKLEDLMTDEQREEVGCWASDEKLFGILEVS